MDFVSTIISNSVSGFVEAGTRSLGNYAGDALIKAGDMIENTGRGVGTSVERAATSYATKISGTPAQKALPAPAAQKMITYGTAAQRADATKMPGKKPANTGAKKGTGSVIGTKKEVSTSTHRKDTALSGGGKKVAPSQTQKNITSTTNKTASVKGATTSTTKSPLPKPYPNNIPYPTAKAKPNTSSLPKPYPQSNTNTNNSTKPSQDKKVPVRQGAPRPFINPDTQSQNTSSSSTKPLYQNSGSKVAVKPGQPRPFINPDANNKKEGESKTASDGKKVAVKKRYERYKPPVEKGAAVHIPEIKI